MLNLIKESYNSKRLSLDFLRMYLGIALFLKGIYFVSNMNEIFSMISYQFPYADFIFAHYVVVAHIGGGACIMLGLFTRYAAIFNLPVMLSAIIFVQSKNGALKTGSEVELAVMVFVLLILFVYENSGIVSADTYIHRSHEASERAEKELRLQNKG